MSPRITHGSAASSSSRSSSSSRRWSYDVFLSFRGEDTRKSFTDHLYHALVDAGINTFRDDNELRRGEDISTELLKAIQDSKMSLIIFSRNYASSRWCLEELAKIMECRKGVGQLVFPIFYHVNPSDVRRQSGSFGEAFMKHEERFKAEMDKVLRWRAALTEAGNLSGWDLTGAKDRYEAKITKKIVEEIINHVNDTYLHVALYPVGIDSRIQDVNFRLSVGSNDVRIIGICGMGGMGKTTIAKAIYNQLFHGFEGKSFLGNVREVSKQPNGQVLLQEKLLFNILRTKKIKISNVDRGITMIKERLCNRKVLVVLDDVDQSDQLAAIARRRDWFGFGSRIIITTRDEHLLKEIEVDNIYMVKKLNDDESLELFSWHAFRKSHPKEDYVDFSKDVIRYCQGLPLALQVLGSFLFGRNAPEWKSALDKLKRIPHNQIYQKLRISFDILEDDKEKDIFLDIACFFIGVDKDYVIKILDGCGFFAEIGISVLVQRCLLTINENNKLTMHDMIRDMGREIVREESLKEPGNCSRLWFYDDVLDILTKHTGTKAVEGLSLKLPTLNEVTLNTKAFVMMHKLRLLQLNYMHIIGGDDHLFKELRWLCWHGFPLEFIPNSFHAENLVAIDMRYSNLRQLWKEIKFLGKLKVLNLKHSHYLTKTPDFFHLPVLEKLILQDCKRLVEVHQSIGRLDRLVSMDMRDCKCLGNLPRSICMLKSLETLDLSGCSKIERLPEDLGEMEALVELLLDETAIRQLPFSIARLKNLKYLSLNGCKRLLSSSWSSVFWSWSSVLWKSPDSVSLLPPSLQGLSSLERLNLQDCNLSYEAFPKNFGSLSALKILDLQNNKFHSLPASFSNLPKLSFLLLDNCSRLQSLPELPSSLKHLYARDCTSLERLSFLPRFQDTLDIKVDNCYKLTEISGLEKLGSSGLIGMEGCNNLASSFLESLLQVWSGSADGAIFLTGDKIPIWFSHQCTGPSLSFQVPPLLGCKMKGFTLCFVYARDIDYDIPYPVKGTDPYPSIKILVKTNGLEWIHTPTCYEISTTPEDVTWVGHLPRFLFGNQLYSGSQVEVVVDIGDGIYVKKCGVHFVYDQAEMTDHHSDAELVLYRSGLNKEAIVNVGSENDGHLSKGQAESKRGRDDDGDSVGPICDSFDGDQHAKRLKYNNI